MRYDETEDPSDMTADELDFGLSQVFQDAESGYTAEAQESLGRFCAEVRRRLGLVQQDEGRLVDALVTAGVRPSDDAVRRAVALVQMSRLELVANVVRLSLGLETLEVRILETADRLRSLGHRA